ncbi:MAG: hypothetical protein ABR927_15705 [Bacteroidales bacterium]|jgi:hypothetical protein
MKKQFKKPNNVFLLHQIEIAKKTIKTPEAILNVLGGMTKEDAIKILQDNDIKFKLQ